MQQEKGKCVDPSPREALALIALSIGREWAPPQSPIRRPAGSPTIRSYRGDVNRSTVVGAGREHSTGADSGAASYGVFARSETQCLNVPYFVLNAATPAFRSVTHILPAATVACCCACDLADAFVETHLPYASAVEP